MEHAGIRTRFVGRLKYPSGAAGRVLLALITLGVVLRVLTIVSWWPVTPTLEDGYQHWASAGPFLDPLHPAGYDLIVAVIGAVTRQIAVTVLLQHLIGIVSALLFGAATWRITGSRWAGLLPAAMVLLGADQIFLEHSIMSESWVVFEIAIGLYAAVRACQNPGGWVWPLVTGAAIAAAVMTRSAMLPLLPVVALAILLARTGSAWRWSEQGRAALVTVGAAGVLLVAFAGANSAFGQRFGIAPSPGWYLYGRVAQFADCRRFTPPPGTASLCQSTPPAQRPSAYIYDFSSQSPAVRRFGAFGRQDGLIGTWARRALLAQVGDELSTSWGYLRAYFVPGWLPKRLRPSSNGLDPQLDFTYPNAYFVTEIKQDLESFYAPFDVHPRHTGLRVLHDWQRVFRFGATLLVITTILTLIGLAIGPFSVRLAVLLFGGGGLSLLVAPVLTGTYAGRYSVPMAGPMMASAAVVLNELLRRARTRRRGAI